MKSSLSNFFYPKSVCVVGASSKEKSIGYEILRSIQTFNFTGEVYPVNPNSSEILGYKCFTTISQIEEAIDLAFVVVPKKFVLDSVSELISKQVKSLVVITAGYREMGSEGEQEEIALLELARRNNVRLVGPNCMGIINSDDQIKLNATFVAEKPEYEPVGFLSQSGALGAAVINSLRETNIKFAHFISVGNKADINEIDLLKFWEKDKSIRLSTYYLESFVDGFKFLEPFLLGKIKKPVIVLKAGKSKAGMKAASSHTGALGSADRVVNAALRQFGIIRVETISEMFITVKGFLHFPIPKGKRIAVVTNAGGPAILAVDALEKSGLELAKFSEATIHKLSEIVPKEGSKLNPIDLLPGGSAEMYKSVIELILKDKNVDAVISIFVEPIMVEPLGVVEAVNSIRSKKPILQVVMPLPEFWENYKLNSELAKPIFRNPEEPASVLSNLLFHSTNKKKLLLRKDEYQSQLKSVNSKLIKRTDFLSQRAINKLARNYKLPLIEEFSIRNDEVEQFEIKNYPIVLKGINEDASHKSDFGAVELGIRTSKEFKAAIKRIRMRMKSFNLTPEYFLIQPHISSRFELLIGGFRDTSFGPMISFGLGGKYVNYFEDFSLRSAFITEDEIREMIHETKIGKIIQGVRGEVGADLDLLIKLISNAAKMIRENKNLSEFDINPLLITEQNEFVIVDFRVKLS
ncbi:MAG: acetate--CoA ligase family protein [Ignavibacteria bacterium]|nr:acetate--CoA ligase family protein [Ignavibacteria bacterium]